MAGGRLRGHDECGSRGEKSLGIVCKCAGGAGAGAGGVVSAFAPLNLCTGAEGATMAKPQRSSGGRCATAAPVMERARAQSSMGEVGIGKLRWTGVVFGRRPRRALVGVLNTEGWPCFASVSSASGAPASPMTVAGSGMACLCRGRSSSTTCTPNKSYGAEQNDRLPK